MIGELTVEDDSRLAFEPTAKPVPAEERARLLADPGFGRVFTDHMAIIEYDEHKGWHDARITARHPFTMDPASPVLHYAQEIFEGLKAYRRPGGGAALFRPEANARRFAKSAIRMAMATRISSSGPRRRTPQAQVPVPSTSSMARPASSAPAPPA